MNNTNIWDAITKIFTGKGGCIKMAIVAAISLGIAGEIIENNYEAGGKTTDGRTFKIRPAIEEYTESPDQTEDIEDDTPEKL